MGVERQWHEADIEEARIGATPNVRLNRELLLIENALSVTDRRRTRLAVERLQLVKALDPIVLKLSEWPFDQSALSKYGLAPGISLAASFGKELVKRILQ